MTVLLIILAAVAYLAMGLATALHIQKRGVCELAGVDVFITLTLWPILWLTVLFWSIMEKRNGR